MLWQKKGAESGQLLAWHPWSGGRIDLSLSQYSNDTTKHIVAEPGEDVQAHWRQRVRCSNDVFDKSTGDWWVLAEQRERGARHALGWRGLIHRLSFGA